MMLATALALQLVVSAAATGSVRADTLWSQSLGTRKQVMVYLPRSYATRPGRRYPVAFYLHGLGGRESDWTQLGRLDAVMDSLVAVGFAEMIVVMPDGDDGWYTTWNSLPSYEVCLRKPPTLESAQSYCVPWPHYDDYVARDVVQFIDHRYRTQPVRARRAIAGLSMGGYGAVWLALAYPDVFTAAASHSGVLAPLYVGPHPFNDQPSWAATGEALAHAWGRLFPRVAPAFGRDTAMWWSRDPGRRLDRLVAVGGIAAVPALFIDVGTSDDLADQSRAFRAHAARLGLSVDYHEWPGGHDWNYWRAHVGESLAWIASQIAR